MRKKTGGRKEGTPNKTTKEIKDIIHKIVEAQLETIELDLDSLETKDKMSILLRLIEYVLPKQREQKIDFSSLTDSEIDELIKRIKDETKQ